MSARSYQTILAAMLILGAGLRASHAQSDTFWSDLDKPEETAAAPANAEASKPDVTKPDVTKPDVTKSDAAKPDAAKPDATKPSVEKPDAAKLGASPAVDAAAAKVVPGGLDTTPTQSLPRQGASGAMVSPPGGDTSAPNTVAAPMGDDREDPEPDVPVTSPNTPSADPLDTMTPAVTTPATMTPATITPALTPPVLTTPSSTTSAPGGASAPSPDAAGSTPTKSEIKTEGVKTDPAGSSATLAKPLQDALAPLNAAIKGALDKRATAEIKGVHAAVRRKEREALASFYAARGFGPIWSTSGVVATAVEPVLTRLAQAGDDALTLTDAPKKLRVSGTPAEIADSEIALSEAVVSYAREATGSRVDPHAISPLIGLKRALADPAEALKAVVGAGAGAGDRLHAFNPTAPRYVALRDQLAAMRAKDGETSLQIPYGRTLRVGMHDARVPLLRTRFTVEASAIDDLDATLYDQAVADAIADFQRGSGLKPSGRLTTRTVAALSGGHNSARERGTIIANMEMWRWMPRELGADRIEVNVPDYLVTVFHNDAAVTQHRVVVGKVDTPTPLFSNAMKYLIVNPYWNVPQSIIKNEMLPKGGGNLSYLGRGYSVSWNGNQPVVKQLPGDRNALGRIKFLFPNEYAVYLHDTPSKSLFSASRRAFSHGCVRVDKPFAFAESVLQDAMPGDSKRRWSEGRLEDMIGDKERYVNFAHPLPIHIEYFTASVSPDDGRLELRDDIYGYAHAVALALGQDSEAPPPAEHKAKPQVAERTRHGGASLRRKVAAAATGYRTASATRGASLRERAMREPPSARAPDTPPAMAPPSVASFFGGIFGSR